jgi:hypothetical protein
MKTNLNEEIKRIKEIMLISEATTGGIVGFLSDTLGFFDNLASKSDDFFKNLKTFDRTKANDFKYGLDDIVKRAIPNITTDGVSPSFLIKQIKTYGDDVAKKELLRFLNTQSSEFADITTNIIKTDEKLLKNVSKIEQSILETELTTLGLEARYIKNITDSLYVSPDLLKQFAAAWKVNWEKFGGARAELSDAIKELDATPGFVDTYKRYLNDEKFMYNMVETMIKDTNPKTKQAFINSMETKLSGLLEKAKDSGDVTELNAIKKYWNWVTNQKTRLNKDAGLWKKTYTTVGTVYFGLLLPLAAIIASGDFLFFVNAEDNKKKFNTTEDGIKLKKEVDEGKKTTADVYSAYRRWCVSEFAKETGMISVWPFKIGYDAVKGMFMHVGLMNPDPTLEERMAEGKKILETGKIPSILTTIHNNALDDKDGKKGFKSWLKTEYYKPTDKFDNEDEALMVQDTTDTNIYYYTPYDNNTKKDLPKLTFEYKDGKFQEKK